MGTIHRTLQFKKDVKRMEKRGKKFDEFKDVIRGLAAEETLEARYRDHVLVGQYKGTRECQFEPDWLLVYEMDGSELILVRTGTHTDLFR
jgi:mRNA interferase YafQ